MKNVLVKVLRLASLFLFFTLVISCKNLNNKEVQVFDLIKIAHNNLNRSIVSISEEFQEPFIKISPENNHAGVVIWEKGDKEDWSKGKFLVFEIYGDNDYSGVINIEFYKETGDNPSDKIILQSGEMLSVNKDKPWISSLMGILPRLKTKIVFPLSYLDAQRLFVPRSPRQLKGTINGNRLDPNDIIKVKLRFGPYFNPYFLPNFKITSISINERRPDPYPLINEAVIDKFGQWKLKEWEGKIKDESELVSLNLALGEIARSATFPHDWNKYGGWKEKRFKATGFFRTQHDGERWWLVDPAGYAFLSTGVDCIRYGSSGPIKGIEDLFDWIPKKEDFQFKEVIENQRGLESVDFYKANLIRVYDRKWKDKWDTITAGLLKEYRINTVGNWSDLDFAKRNNLSYVLPLRDFPSTQVVLYRDFPDVFSEEYIENSKKFAEQLSAFKDDPYLVGYFLRNEPEWAFGYHNLAYEMFGTNQKSKTKSEFIRWIKGKYKGDILTFNKAWKLNLKSFENLELLILKENPSKTANSDFYDFSIIMVKRYVDIPCDEVTKIDKNHLNLGMRYAWLSSDLLYKAGERFDVFSINGYGIDPPPTEDISKISGKPIMIGEFHHGAVDRGLPATGIVGVLNQKDRAKAYRNYIEQGFARPEIIGMHYFEWIDQPFYGRSDGENYNIGIMTMNNLPYLELTNAMKITNERIYKVASGLIKPFKDSSIIKIPPIHY